MSSNIENRLVLRTASALTVLCLTCSLCRIATADNAPCTPTYDVPIGGTTDTIEGPACVRVRFNALQFRAKLGENVTKDGAVDVSGLFPVTPAAAPKRPPVVSKCDRHPSDQASMELALKVLFECEGEIRDAFDGQMASVRSDEKIVAESLADIKSTALAADGAVSSANGPNDLKTMMSSNVARTKTKIDSTLGLTWPDFESTLRSIRKLEDDLANVPFLHLDKPAAGTPCPGGLHECTYDFSEFAKTAQNATNYSDLKTRVQQLETATRAVLTDGTRYQTLQAKLYTLQFWQKELSPITEQSFFITRWVTGGTLFNFAKHKTEQLALQDRLPTLQQQDLPESKVINEVTVDFGNPIALSAGVAFSTLGEREFAIVDSSSGTTPPSSVKRFGTTNHSSVHPMPIGIVHARLWEQSSHIVGLHGSFGISGNFQSDSAGGSGPEFLSGLSISVRRFVYVTTGLHVGRTSKLAGGFHEGDLVPEGITTPPVEKSYTPGFGVAISFTKP